MKFTRLAFLAFAGLMFATSCVQAQNAPSQSLIAKAPGDLLRKADAMMKSGKPMDAYNLLEPKEDEYSGDTSFDYLLGIAALDSGKPDRATIAFERILAVNPKFAGARLDLARAYFAMGSDDMARSEFETVLEQNPPAEAAAVVKKYLDVIEERRQAKLQQLTGYLETSIGHDNNLTAATTDNVAGVAGILGMTSAELISQYQYQPTGSSLQYSGIYTAVSGGVNFNRLLSEEKGISLFVGADLKQIVYSNYSSMNNLNLNLSGGLGIVRGDDNFRVFGSFGQYRQTGFPQATPSNSYRDTSAVGLEWRRILNSNNQMTWSLSYSQPRYVATPEQDSNQTSVNASLLHIFEGKTTPLIFTNLNYSVDRALHPLNTTSSTDMSRTSSGILAHFQLTPIANTDFFLSGGLTVRQDDSAGARSSPGLPSFFARDLTQTFSFGVTTRPWTKWSLNGTVAITDNRSNLSLYQYRRNDSTLTLRRDF